MSDTQIVLKVSYSSRSEHVEHHLPHNTVIQLFLDRAQGLLKLRQQTKDNGLASDVVGTVEARGALLIFETFLSGVFLEVEAVSGLSRVEIDHSLNHKRSKAYLAAGYTICIDHYGTSVAITRPSQHSTHVLTPPATDADTMPPPLPTESQLAQEMESPQHITGPDDETEDEEQDPVIPPTSDAAQPPEVASEAASRSLRRETRTKRNARDAYEVDLQQPPVKKTKSSQISPSSPAPHHPHSESEAPFEPAAAETAPEPTRAVENDASAVSQSPEQPKVDGGAEESALGPADEDERRNGENATPNPTQTSDTTEDDAVDETDDKIVVARPTASNKKRRQSRSSLVSNSTLTPNSTSSRSQPSPFLNRPKRTVLLSCLSPDAATKRWAKKYGITLQDDVPGSRANFLCVVKENRSQDPSSLPTTVKVLRTLLAKKLVVSETWIAGSKEEDDVLDPSDYAVADGSERNRTKLFSGMTVYFTQKAGKSEDIKALAVEAGATRVECGTPSKGMSLTPKTSVILLADKNDTEGKALVKEGRVVYERSLLTQSILRGELDLESDEFRLS